MLYRSGLKLAEALEQLERAAESEAEIRPFVEFIQTSSRSLVRSRRHASPLRVALVAGEASGDTLGAGLIEALRRREPDAQFFGVAGPKMRAAGCEVWEPAESLAVMGLFEVLRELPRLVRLLSRLRAPSSPPAPTCSSASMRRIPICVWHASSIAAGIPTVQYVSPQVWAWRQGRVHTMHESVDLVLCLLPFESSSTRTAGCRAEFVGHPLADAIPLDVDRARRAPRLGLPAAGGDRRAAARQPARRGDASRGGLRANRRLARGAAPRRTLRRAHGERGGAGDFFACAQALGAAS